MFDCFFFFGRESKDGMAIGDGVDGSLLGSGYAEGWLVKGIGVSHKASRHGKGLRGW